ncbi:uncharacterized protein METZ01_LOCUS252351, partial [marine metagenome]
MLMVFVPVVCNVDSAAKPDISMAFYMIKKFFQRGGASGPTDQSAVQ